MKIQKLLFSFLAACVIVAGCQEEEPMPTIPSLSVGQSEISFDKGGGTTTLTVTSNRPWSISTDADWLAFNPSEGTASDAPVNVTVTALGNAASDRVSSFKVKTDFDYKTIVVTQPGEKGVDPTQTATGEGTADDPYNVIAALEKAKTLVPYNNGDDYNTENSATVYTMGKVVSVEIDPSYGNATYYISADGTANTQLEVYRGKYLGGANFLTKDQLKVGDEVVVYGTIVNFKGNTPEYTAGSMLISINGNTKPDEIDYTKFELVSVKAFIDKADKVNFFRLKGTVSRFNKQYCSFDLTDDSGTIYVYNVSNKDEWSDKISNGGTVELAGLYTYYEKNDQHEVVSANIISFESGSGGDHSDVEAATVAEFINTANTNKYFKLTGTVSKFNAQYCSFDLTDASGTIYVYSVDNKAEWSSKISNGGTVTLAGKYAFYQAKEQHEVVEAQILSFEPGSGGGDQSDAEAATVAEFINTANPDKYFKLTGTVSKFNAQYCSFDLTDASGTIYVYSVVNKADWSSKITNGGTVTLAGKYAFYQAKEQHEVVDAQILSFEGEGGGQGGDSTPKGTGTLADPYNPAAAAAAVKDLTWTSNQDYQTTDVVYVKGKIASIANNGTFTGGGTYGNASFYISEDGSSEGTFYVFRTLYLGNKKYESGQTDIKVGDEVVICGKLMNYHGNTPETEAGSSYLYSLNGKTDGGEGGGEQGGDDGQSAGGGSVVTGNVETITFANCGLENSVQYPTIKGKKVKITFGDGNNDGKYYSIGTGIRIYKNGYVQITSEKDISKIVFTFDENKDSSGNLTYPNSDCSVNVGTVAVNEAVVTWTGSDKTVKMTRGAGNGHWRLQKVEVTLAE